MRRNTHSRRAKKTEEQNNREGDIFMELIVKINGILNSFAWGPVMLVLLVGTGIFLTARTGCIQVRRFGYIMRTSPRSRR